MRKLTRALACAAALALPTAAGAVTYSFTALSSGGDFDAMGAFTFAYPGFLGGSTFVPASQLESCSITFGGTLGVCRYAQFTEGGTLPASITFGGAPDPNTQAIGLLYVFQPDAFAKFGSYDSIGDQQQRARLVVSQGAAVPEPAAWSLMIAGFGATGAALRRRSRRLLAAA